MLGQGVGALKRGGGGAGTTVQTMDIGSQRIRLLDILNLKNLKTFEVSG